jgi:gliding motility-associated-like protein
MAFVDCAILSSNVEFVETKASPLVFNVMPVDTVYYCLGEPGVKIELSGCEPDVFYELYNAITGDRVDYYLPSPAETAAGSAFKFRASQFEGDYRVQGRYLSGGCVSLMNDTSHIVLDDYTGNCIPLVAVDDLISMGKSDVTVNDSIYLNDIYNSMIDTIGSNLEYTLITNWIYFDGINSINVETLGEASINQNGVLTYTKLPGFFGRDSVKYIVQNTNEPSRVDTALVIIMVGNQSLEDGTLLIPNMITPNGDAYNQTLVISGLIEDKLVDINDSRVKSTLEIYNRWGTLVYKSKGEKYMNDWDGRGNGPMASKQTLKLQFN